jgi:hypothetical protein
MQATASPMVTVVIATHDRHASLFRALQAVAAQDYDDMEVLVIDDCSSTATREKYREFWPSLDSRFSLIPLPPSASRRSPSVTRNYGITMARGRFVAFCDDDDLWIRTDHVRVAVTSLLAQDADLLVGNMQTAADGQIRNPNWYQPAWDHLAGRGRTVPGSSDLYRVDRDMRTGFLAQRTPHANTLVVRRALLARTGAYWDRIVFAEDHDLAYRLFDQAVGILFRSSVVAELDVGPHASVARDHEADERSIFGIAACLRAATLISDPGLRRGLRSNRAWRLFELGQSQARAGHHTSARELALEALKVHPSGAAARLYVASLCATLRSWSRVWSWR